MTQPSIAISLPSLFNIGLQDDESVIAGFVARQDLLDYFLTELQSIAPQGTVQHHLIIGARGMGKTTLLKRLAIAIRQNAKLSAHLIPLTFPEEQYNVKDLADLWLNAMDALGDELERSGKTNDAHDLDDAIARLEGEGLARDTLARRARALLVEHCAALGRRPVMLVDNIDIVFSRVDKLGRKVKNPDSGAYWELREALSRSDSPVLIGGSVRLSEPMVTYEKAFYDFFAVHRLDKLTFDEMRAVLGNLADRHGVPLIRRMLIGEIARLRTLHDLTGGNVRTVLFLFHLLAQGVESDVREDLERLLDMVTPLYKARFEELAEQSQVVLHALAMRWNSSAARDVAADCRLATGVVSAQLEALQREGMVDKVQLGGSRKMGYQVAERFFNLWLLMRTSRRMRQKLAYLTKFLESFYDAEERRDLAHRLLDDTYRGKERSRAELAWALANSMEGSDESLVLKAHAGSLLLDHCSATNQRISEIIGDGDLPVHQMTLLECREAIRRNADRIRQAGVDPEEFELAAMGSIGQTLDEKRQIANFINGGFNSNDLKQLTKILDNEKRELLVNLKIDANGLHGFRRAVTEGLINPDDLTLTDVKAASKHYKAPELLSSFWTLLFEDEKIICAEDTNVSKWIDWAWKEIQEKRLTKRSSEEWKQFAIRYAKRRCYNTAALAYQKAIELEPSDTWLCYLLGNLLKDHLGRTEEAEIIYRKGLEINPSDGWLWNQLGDLLHEHFGKHEEAEKVYRKGLEFAPTNGWLWDNLGNLLEYLGRYDEAEQAYQKGVDVNPTNGWLWCDLGDLLKNKLGRNKDAEQVYRKGIKLDSTHAWLHAELGSLLDDMKCYDEAEQEYKNALKIMPDIWKARNNLAILALRRGDIQVVQEILADKITEKALAPSVRTLISILIELRRDNWGVASESFRELFAGFVNDVSPKLLNDLLLIFSWAIVCRQGEKMLALLDELGARDRFWPLVAGFEAALADDADMLLNTAPEARGAAQRIFETIRHQCEGLLIKP